MRPLIISATREEIKDSIPFLEENNIPYLITGVGMVATTFSLTQKLINNTYDYLLNVGIAGSLNKKIEIGSVTEIYKDIFTELGAEDGEEFIKINDLGFGQNDFEVIKHENIHTNLPKRIGITVNTIHGCSKSIDRLKKIFPEAEVESMEGAAILYVANKLNIPAIQVRSISNYVEKRDKSQWNIPLAIDNLNMWLQSHLKSIY